MPLIFSISISLFLIATASLLFRRSGSGRVSGVLFGTAVFISFLLYVAYVVSDRFTGEGVNEAVLYHLRYGLKGAGFAEYRGLIILTLGAILAGLIVSYWVPWAGRDQRGAHWMGRLAAFALVLASVAPNPIVADFAALVPASTREDGEFHRYYQRPYIRETDADARNLVFIYAEGLEQTFFDERLFPGLITGLRELQAQSTVFTNIRQVYATEHTIAGIVASQCGIPLTAPFLGNRMRSVDRYLPGAVGLGDLLHYQGYYLGFLGGAPLDFAGKGKFFRTHKFDEVLGRDELVSLIDDGSYQSRWGLYDDTLFEIAYNRFLEHSAARERFGMFLLTLDTHQPEGHQSRSGEGIIYGDGSNPMLNAVAASDRLITELIERIRSSPYGDRTVVVVASDHLALPNTATEILNEGTRRNLFMILEPGVSRGRQVDQLGSTLDIGPTLLPFIGYEGGIGLGRNLLDENLDQTEITHIQTEEHLRAWKGDLDRFWGFPSIEHSLCVDVPRSRVVLDEREFGIPALITLRPGLQTQISFPYHPDGSDKALIQEVRNLEEGIPFLLIDRCENARSLSSAVKEHGWCVIAGNGRGVLEVRHVERMRTWSRDEIKKLTGQTQR